MGRSRGGSRRGGRRGGRSRGGSRSSGSRSSGSSVRISSEPFSGCYNRSYYHKGVYHSYYTVNKDYGTDKFRPIWNFIKLVLLACFVLYLMTLFVLLPLSFDGKVDGNPDRIVIQDTIDLLTPEEEQSTLELFQEVYEKCGMPVTLYTDDMEWKSKYDSTEVYSEELYYAMGTEEDAMIILFTYDGTFDWDYNMYCGDDTILCLPDATFDKLADNFHKGMAGQNLCDALDYSFHSIMDDLGQESFSIFVLLWDLLCLGVYCFFVGLLFSDYLKQKRAYKYFKENPEKLEDTPMLVKYECPSCGAPNSGLAEVCEYCQTVLKL